MLRPFERDEGRATGENATGGWLYRENRLCQYPAQNAAAPG